jgi:hypothetical protein
MVTVPVALFEVEYQDAQSFLVRDHDSIYGSDFRRRVKSCRTRCLITPPRSPQANAIGVGPGLTGRLGTLARLNICCGYGRGARDAFGPGHAETIDPSRCAS